MREIRGKNSIGDGDCEGRFNGGVSESGGGAGDGIDGASCKQENVELESVMVMTVVMRKKLKFEVFTLSTNTNHKTNSNRSRL